MKITICPDKRQLGKEAATTGAEIIRSAIKQNGEARMVVATGGSQLEVVAELAASEGIDWPSVTVFHLDEYVGMSITHSASFRRFLWQRFASQLPLPLKACHYINADENPEQECARVGALLRERPIDVGFIGIGENGHLAFNDPPADFETDEPYIVVDLDQRCRLQQVGEGWFNSLEQVPQRAISMSIKQVMACKTLIVSVPDQRKAEAVQNSVKRDVDPKYPSTCLQKHNDVYLYLDPDSASLLESEVVA